MQSELSLICSFATSIEMAIFAYRMCLIGMRRIAWIDSSQCFAEVIQHGAELLDASKVKHGCDHQHGTNADVKFFQQALGNDHYLS